METKSQRKNRRRAEARAARRLAASRDSATSRATTHKPSESKKEESIKPTTPEERAAVAHLVVHCRRNPFDVYIGRGGRHEFPPSIWGNPFRLKAEYLRDQVCEDFEAYLLSKPELLAKLKSLKGKVLGCWCSPRRCHGHTLAALANR